MTLLLLCRYPAVLAGITFHAYATSKLFHFLSFVIHIIICLICHLEPNVQRCCQGQSYSPLWCNCSSDGYAVGEAEQTPVHQRLCPAVDLILLLSTNHLQTPPSTALHTSEQLDNHRSTAKGPPGQGNSTTQLVFRGP